MSLRTTRLVEASLIRTGVYSIGWDTVDPLAEAVGCFVDITDADGVSFRQPASPARFPGADDTPKRPAPKLGQHTREVLAAAGYAEADIDRLINEGAAR